LPVRILLRDPFGRRVGYDPVVGAEVNEIGESATYSGADSAPQIVTVEGAPRGSYLVEASAVESGAYTLAISADDLDHDFTIASESFSGNAKVAQPVTPLVLDVPRANGTQVKRRSIGNPGGGPIVTTCPPVGPTADQVRIEYTGALSGCNESNGLACSRGETIDFRGSTVGYEIRPQCDQFEWNFGDGSSLATTQDSQHTFGGVASAYSVSFRVFNAAGGATVTRSVAMAGSTASSALTGTVRHLVTSNAVSGAAVSFGSLSGTTNSSGVYTLNGITCGSSTLTASKSGFLTESSNYLPTNCPGTSTKDVILAPIPSISNVSPSSGPTTGGNVVTILGANLQFAQSVKFGGTSTSYEYSASTGDLRATVPARSAGAVTVQVVTLGGTASLTNGYTYVASNTGTLTGTVRHLVASKPVSGAAVSFGSLSGTTNSSGVYSLNGITCGSNTLAVSKSGFLTESSSYTPTNCPGTTTKDVTLAPIPSISGVSPSSGPTSGGNPVTILGANLQFAQAVKFGGTSAQFSYNPTTGDLQATVPAHSEGAVTVQVVTLGGTASLSNAYTYVALNGAQSYSFSYRFASGDLVTGTFTGTPSGNLITGLTNIAVFINGVPFRGNGHVYNLGWVYNQQLPGNPGSAVASFDGAGNAFSFYDYDPSGPYDPNGRVFASNPYFGGQTTYASFQNSVNLVFEGAGCSCSTAAYVPTNWTITRTSATALPVANFTSSPSRAVAVGSHSSAMR
jgi:hypothetical protein